MKSIREIIESVFINFPSKWGLFSDYFNFHISKSNWGIAIFIMSKIGVAFGQIYWFDKDTETVYLDWLSVDEAFRREGLGTKLQLLREEIGRSIGASYSCLWVNKSIWMYDWYIRRGYEYYMDYDDEENSVWLRKSLLENIINQSEVSNEI